MKLVAATRVLNEADIIEAFVRHTASYVDHHIFVDNGSVDGTLAILKQLIAEGLKLSLFQNRSRSFMQAHVNTFLYRQAIAEHGADWVMIIDADEFIDDRSLHSGGGSFMDEQDDRPLHHYLAGFAASYSHLSILRVRLRDYQVTASDTPDPIVPRRLTRCGPLTDNVKSIYKADLLARQVVIQPGGHGAWIDGGTDCPALIDPTLCYAHYANRSPYQRLTKSAIGWAKILASGPAVAGSGVSYHYRGPFEQLRADPAKLLRSAGFMNPPSGADLTHDPISYCGGALKYTKPVDYQMRAVQVLVTYLEELATQHGEMMELFNKVNSLIHRDETEFTRLA